MDQFVCGARNYKELFRKTAGHCHTAYLFSYRQCVVLQPGCRDFATNSFTKTSPGPSFFILAHTADTWGIFEHVVKILKPSRILSGTTSTYRQT